MKFCIFHVIVNPKRIYFVFLPRIMTTSSVKLNPGGSAYENMKHEVDALSRVISKTQITNEKHILHENESVKSTKSDTENNELADHGSDSNGHIVVIDIEEKALKCDKRLLTQHSKYFEALFAFQETPTNRVRLKGIIYKSLIGLSFKSLNFI